LQNTIDKTHNVNLTMLEYEQLEEIIKEIWYFMVFFLYARSRIPQSSI